MPEDDFRALVEDVRANGVRERGMLLEGQILDGRHRARASAETGRSMEWGEFADLVEARPGLTPVEYVISLNLRRRHLNEAQRALVAARLVETRQGQRSDLVGAPTKSQAAMAKSCSVSRDSVIQAAAVLERGAPELVAAVEAGAMPLKSARMVAELPADEQGAIVTAAPKIREAALKDLRGEGKRQRRASRLEAIRLKSEPTPGFETGRRYPVLYADPCWRFRSGMTERSIENHYPTMSIEEICALPVGEIAHDDAVLFLWTTSPNLEEAFRVLEAWGFTYKASAVWDKGVAGMGYWYRVRHEILLVATRGDFPAPAEELRPSSVYTSPRGRHSEKPEAVRDDIARMFPGLPRIELFARTDGAPAAGWDVWGNQS
jgi:N6-adenosine-specific RNA methylase IME4